MHEPGTYIIIGSTRHAGLFVGQKGQVVARHPEGGYAVEVPNIQRIALFGGGSRSEPGVVFLEENEFTDDKERNAAKEETIVNDNENAQ